jgi:uncharacterized RDD family membrane protein YckC
MMTSRACCAARVMDDRMSYSGFSADMALTSGITGRRLGGWLVDAILVGVVMTALSMALWILGFITFGLGWFLLGGLWVIPVAYVFGFVASPAQATPGQSIAGLRVVRDDDLGRPSPAQALVYAVGYAVTMSAGMIWLLAAFFTRRARCLHDIVAGVAVLRADALGLAPAPLARDGWAVR